MGFCVRVRAKGRRAKGQEDERFDSVVRRTVVLVALAVFDVFAVVDVVGVFAVVDVLFAVVDVAASLAAAIT